MSEFTMPSLGADMDAGTLVEWLVHEGDTVHRGDLMAVVDTDKSAIEVEAFADGVVEAFLVEPGSKVAVGTPLARLAPLGSPAPTAPSAPSVAPSAPVERAPSAVIPAPRSPRGESGPARLGSPPLRHHAAELGVDLTEVSGTGPHGEITRADVDRAAAAKAGAPLTVPAGAAPAVAPAPPGTGLPSTAPAPESAGAAHRRRVSPYARRLADELGVDLADVTAVGRDGAVRAEQVRAAAAARKAPTAPATAVEPPAGPPARPPGGLSTGPSGRTAPRATIAALMSRAKREIPHYYVAETVDLSALTTWLRRTNRDRPVSERIVPAAALIKATALTAREHPELNGFWIDDAFVPGEDIHLGVAVHVRGGALVAPAIHHTADLDLPRVMAALRDLVSRARAGRLRRTELADPTLTITDLGDQGVEEVIGVIYPPQVALVGVGRIAERPWAVDGMIGARPTVRLTLSGDHRATDGAAGARFLATLEQHLQHPEEL